MGGLLPSNAIGWVVPVTDLLSIGVLSSSCIRMTAISSAAIRWSSESLSQRIADSKKEGGGGNGLEAA